MYQVYLPSELMRIPIKLETLEIVTEHQENALRYSHSDSVPFEYSRMVCVTRVSTPAAAEDRWRLRLKSPGPDSRFTYACGLPNALPGRLEEGGTSELGRPARLNVVCRSP